MDTDETVEIRDTAKAPARSFRARLRRIFRKTRLVLGALILLAEAAAVAFSAVWLSRHGEKLRENDCKDPYAWIASPRIGNGNVAYSRKLPNGETITIDNRGALFLGDVLKDDAVTERLFPTFRAAIDFARERHLPLLPSLSMIHHRFKLENDRLIEAVQLAAFRGQQLFLRDLLNVLLVGRGRSSGQDQKDYTTAAAFVASALFFATDSATTLPREVQKVMRDRLEEFESGRRAQLRMFNEAVVAERYARNPELARVFKQGRFLMGELECGPAAVILAALSNDERLLPQFLRFHALFMILDNPPEVPCLAQLLMQHNTKTPIEWRRLLPEDPIYFFPTAFSPENGHYYRYFRDGGIPRNISWMDQIMDGIRSGKIDPVPTGESGWYDYQLFALLPLIRTDHAMELYTKKLRSTDRYRAFMAATFRAALANDRETHVLRIQPPVKGLISSFGPLTLSPHFSCEPTPAVYYRLSGAYRFFARALERIGHASVDMEGKKVAETLEMLERRALALCALSLLELGIPPDGLLTDPLPEGFPQSLQRCAEEWLAALPDDSALAEDRRFAIDAADGHKWANVGVRFTRLRYAYEAPPKVESRHFLIEPTTLYAPVAVFAEFRRPIPEGTFGAFCDRYPTVRGCLSALSAFPQSNATTRIPLNGLLIALMMFVVLDAGLFVFGWKRPRLAWLHSIAWWSAAAVVVVFAATNSGQVFVLLHLAPRFEVPRVPLAYLSASQIRKWHEDDYSRTPSRIVEAWRWNCSDWLVAQALRSRSPAVRENALNLYPVEDAYTTRTKEAVLQLCETRDYDETDCGLLWIGGFERYWTPGFYHEGSEAARRDVPRLLAILQRFDNDPAMVARCASALGISSDPSILPLLKETVRKSPPSDPFTMYLILAVLRLQPEKLPLDALHELERDPAGTGNGSTGPATYRHLIPRPSVAAVGGLMSRNWDFICGMNDDISTIMAQRRNLPDRSTIERGLQDLRVVDFVLPAAQESQEWEDPIAWLTIHISDAQRSYFYEKMATWFIEAPPDASFDRYRMAFVYFLGSWSCCNDQPREPYRKALERVYASGRWNNQAYPVGKEKTVGQYIEIRLENFRREENRQSLENEP